MQAERAPYVGIVLALVILCAETIGLAVYSPQPAQPTPHAQRSRPVHHCHK